MSYNLIDVLPDDIFSKILSFNVDMIEKEILKIELALLTFISATDKKLDIDICNDTVNDNSSYINTYYDDIHINYDGITYSMDEFLLDIIEYEKICIVSRFSMNRDDTEYSLISPVMFNATYYDILKQVSFLNDIKNSYLALTGAEDEIDEDHHFLESLNVVSCLSLKKTKKLYKLPKIKDIVFLEAGFGS